jgi:hypothetical protein
MTSLSLFFFFFWIQKTKFVESNEQVWFNRTHVGKITFCYLSIRFMKDTPYLKIKKITNKFGYEMAITRMT